jgi:DNA-binding IclR family transcriptional regulator
VKRSASSRQLAREWRTLQALAEKPRTVAELAALTGVSKASAQRDVAVLSEVFAVTRSPVDTHKQMAVYSAAVDCPNCLRLSQDLAVKTSQLEAQGNTNLALIREHEKRVVAVAEIVREMDLKLKHALCGVMP